MKVYNTLSKQKEELIPVEEGKIKIYVCGPTVYDYIHIGNARPMIVFDTVRRYLNYKGYDVKYVSNFTDVDDKIINKALQEGIPAGEISSRYIAECKTDMEALEVLPADVHPLATEEISGMIEMIADLVGKGYAYAAKDGTVYFRTGKSKSYGKLSHKKLEDLQSGHRTIQVAGNTQKESESDFVLWKPKKDGEPYWESPWCDGRPGWHIECSVMAKKHLGTEIDIHGGGEDLIFPHHENEIAQSEAANGKSFAKYWMHNGFLNIENKKMSKSDGNFFTVREVTEKYDPQVLRFFMLSAHYRSPLNFSRDLMEAAKAGLDRILTAADHLRRKIVQTEKTKEDGNAASIAKKDGNVSSVFEKEEAAALAAEEKENTKQSAERRTASLTAEEKAIYEESNVFVQKFEAAMEDDFNTADGISVIFEFVKYCNTLNLEGASGAFWQALYERLNRLCDIMGILLEKKEEILDTQIEDLITQRTAAKKNKDFARADEIRATLLEQGIALEDTREGVIWKRV